MNRKILFLTLLVSCIVLETKAQYVYEKDTSCVNYIGLQTKIIDYLPIELSFVHLRNNGLSYLVKLSYVQPFGNDDMNYSLFENIGVIDRDVFEHNKSVKAYSLKSGVMLWRFYDDYFGSRYVSINGTATYAKERFTLITDDVIYGKTTKNYDENNLYSTIELEAQKITRYGLNFGVLLGYKIINPIAFSSFITGIENATTYSPGSGFGSKLYFNIKVGYHFKFSKK